MLAGHDDFSRDVIYCMIDELLELRVHEFEQFNSYMDSLKDNNDLVDDSVIVKLGSFARISKTAEELSEMIYGYKNFDYSLVPSLVTEGCLQDSLIRKYLDLVVDDSVVDQFNDCELRLVNSLRILMNCVNYEHGFGL